MKKKFWIVYVALLAQLVGCSREFRTCRATYTCPPTGGTGGEAGSAGQAEAEGGEGGSSGNRSMMAAGSAGEANAEGGTAGAAAEEAGAAGATAATCGDGDIDHGEDCDDGARNGPGKACNAQCMRNICGDGDTGPGEVCDNGPANGIGLLKCAPDCSRIVDVKHIVFSTKSLPTTNLAPNPVAAADSTCPEGYKALFSYGTSRRATTTPFKTQSSIDWVLRPYTYYYNSKEEPVWLTDSVALLGVRNGQFKGLENAIAFYIAYMATGLNVDFTTLATNNCQGWTSNDTAATMAYGLAGEPNMGFIFKDVVSCGGETWFYCVEQ